MMPVAVFYHYPVVCITVDTIFDMGIELGTVKEFILGSSLVNLCKTVIDTNIGSFGKIGFLVRSLRGSMNTCTSLGGKSKIDRRGCRSITN